MNVIFNILLFAWALAVAILVVAASIPIAAFALAVAVINELLKAVLAWKTIKRR